MNENPHKMFVWLLRPSLQQNHVRELAAQGRTRIRLMKAAALSGKAQDEGRMKTANKFFIQIRPGSKVRKASAPARSSPSAPPPPPSAVRFQLYYDSQYRSFH